MLGAYQMRYASLAALSRLNCTQYEKARLPPLEQLLLPKLLSGIGDDCVRLECCDTSSAYGLSVCLTV